MQICVMAGGGLSSWYIATRLSSEKHNVTVWLAEVGQLDERFKALFVESMTAQHIPVCIEDRTAALASLGIEAARYQGRQSNGYWNTTGLLRVSLVTGASAFLDPLRNAGCVAHGCVGFGNDQRRFDRLFSELSGRVTVLAPLSRWMSDGEELNRERMVNYVECNAHLNPGTLAAKVTWSSDGSILGVANEGAAIESLAEDWTIAPFVMTADPLRDSDAEEVIVEIEQGRVVKLGGATGDDGALLGAANSLAGRRGVGRIAVMEDRLSGSKCRGVYEAPGLQLLGETYRALYDAVLGGTELKILRDLARNYSDSIYSGEYCSNEAAATRQRLQDLTARASGTVRMVMRGGLLQVIAIRVSRQFVKVERRFDQGGVAWNVSGIVMGRAEREAR